MTSSDFPSCRPLTFLQLPTVVHQGKKEKKKSEILKGEVGVGKPFPVLERRIWRKGPLQSCGWAPLGQGGVLGLHKDP